MQPQLCKNCEHVFQGNFCSNCGQKTNTVRLDWHYIQEELKYTFLHINKGLLFTVKELLTRPGKSVREFIEGKRIRHYKPILLVFVLAGLNGLLSHYFHFEKMLAKLDKLSTTQQQQKRLPFNQADIYTWIVDHYAIFELALLPVISLCSWLAFKKWGYNYVENIIINSYASGARLAVSILFFPLIYLTSENDFFILFTAISGLFSVGITVWLYVQLYSNRDLGHVILRILLFGALFMIFYLLAIVLGIIYLITTHKFN